MEATARELGGPYREPRRVRGRGVGEINDLLDLEEWAKDTTLHQRYLPKMPTEGMLLPTWIWREGQWLIFCADAPILRAACEGHQKGHQRRDPVTISLAASISPNLSIFSSCSSRWPPQRLL